MSGLPVAVAGNAVTSVGSSVEIAVPADSAGCLPNVIRVAATAAGYFKVGQSGLSAQAGDVLIQPADSVLMLTHGQPSCAFKSVSGSATAIVTPVDFGGRAYPAGTLFTLLSLFMAGEQGAWYDPSDLTTLYQDSAGTTPVTAVEQPVGLIKDKSGRGNHAYQTVSASRPVLSARVNLLTKTEQFDDAVWVKSNTTVAANVVAAPDGMLTADKLIEDTVNNTHQLQAVVVPSAATQYTYSAYVKAAERSYVLIQITFGGLNTYAIVNLTNGNVGAITGGGVVLAQSVGGGWFRISISATAATTASGVASLYTCQDATTFTYTGDGTSGIYIWGADLRVSNDGASLPPYQRVNTSTDYDTAGFPMYLACDGIDDGMVTNSIDFTATDKMTVWAGVRKLSDAALGMFAELSSGGAQRSFQIRASDGANANYAFSSIGTAGVTVTSTASFPAPTTNVLTGIGAISTPVATLRVNGTEVASASTTQGTGNYGNYPLYLFRRGGTSLPFNGRFYGLIVRGAQSSAAQIAAGEAWMNSKTRAY